ncbi:hypothetical protein [Histidinibacterium aquaticum]|nr:hypothetical protein [Histidinibacterium aquaticum]
MSHIPNRSAKAWAQNVNDPEAKALVEAAVRFIGAHAIVLAPAIALALFF